MAFGAPRCGDGTGASGVCDGEGVSDGNGVGELCFFRWGEPLTLGDGEADSSGDSLGLGVAEDFFLCRADAFGFGVAVGEIFFLTLGAGVADGFGVAVGVGDFFFVAVAVVFFFRCGLGVGVEKIFFSACPSVSSAARVVGGAILIARTKIKSRTSM